MASEVTLGTKLKEDGVLILELVPRRRLGSRRAENGRALELLVKVEPLDFRRQGQALDRRPAGDGAELRDVEVGIADIVGADRLAGRGIVGADERLDRKSVV